MTALANQMHLEHTENTRVFHATKNTHCEILIFNCVKSDKLIHKQFLDCFDFVARMTCHFPEHKNIIFM